MRIWPGITILITALVLAQPAWAEDSIRLDQDRISALSALPALQGEPVMPDALDGRITVVTFFASWCPPCREELLHLKEFRARHGAEVAVVAVNIFEDFGGVKNPGRLSRFLEVADPAFYVLGEGERISSLFGDVRRIPTLFLFDNDGRSRLHFIHERDATKMFTTTEELEAAIAGVSPGQ